MKQNMKKAIGLSLKRYNDTYMKAANDRIDNIVSQAGTDNTEIVDARIDSAGVAHTTLNNRILAETKMNNQHLVSCSGEHITAENTMGGSITNLEVLGNTIQNEEDLADIKSVGVLQEDGTYKMSILSCGKNLCNTSKLIGGSFVEFKNKPMYKFTDGNKPFEFTGISYLENTAYTLSIRMFRDDDQTSKLTNIIIQYTDGSATDVLIRSGEKKHISTDPNKTVAKIKGAFNYSANVYIDLEDLQIEEGTVATTYEPYQGNKCDILLPCQLEKVGEVSDRLFRREDGVWGVEKNVVDIVFNGSEQWQYNSNTKEFYLTKNNYIYDGNYGCICDKFTYGETGGNYNNVI